MKHPVQDSHAFTLIETLFTAVLIGVLGLLVYSLLNIGTILGAKNSAVNVAHQTARIAMLQMTQDFHSAVSPFQLVDANGNNVAGTGPAEGVAFHLWSKDTNGNDSPPFKVKTSDAAAGQNTIHIVATTATKPISRAMAHDSYSQHSTPHQRSKWNFRLHADTRQATYRSRSMEPAVTSPVLLPIVAPTL